MINNKIRFVGILVVLLLFGFITTSFISYYVAHDSLSSQIEETTLPLTSDNIYFVSNGPGYFCPGLDN